MTPVKQLQFRGGWLMAFIPVIIFLALCVLFFVVFKAFDMGALAMSGVVALMVGAALSRDYKGYWDAVMRGIGSPTSVTIVMILLVISMFSALVKATHVAGGFIWIGTSIGIKGGGFTAFAFITVCLVSMATGSSIGTMFTAFPFFYPAGVLLGAHPALLAGAIVSGAIFGDNLAPISDTTTISSSTQKFRRKDGVADIAGVVTSRAKYAIVSAVVCAVGFLLLGGTENARPGASDILEKSSNPVALFMLIPVAIMLVVAFLTRNIFKAVSVGLVLGIITGLLTGLLSPAAIIGVKEGVPTGFLVSGVNGMLGTIALVISVFGIMGVLTAAGVLDRVVDALVRGRLSRTPQGAEIAIGLGVSLTTMLFGGVNSAAMVTFGPVADEIGARTNLHPYRRANVMDCFAMGIGCIIPFLSAYLFIGASLTAGYDGVPALNTTQIMGGTFYPMVLTAVMVVAVLTGWGRRFEGRNGSQAKTQEVVEHEPAVASVAR